MNSKIYVRPVIVGCYGKSGCSVGNKSNKTDKDNNKERKDKKDNNKK
ncbi:MAG: hypothetical protein ACOX3T_04660 [Bdellovibrionota bacterium]